MAQVSPRADVWIHPGTFDLADVLGFGGKRDEETGVVSEQTKYHPYLTMAEGFKLAAQSFGKDVKALSCCVA